MLQLLKNQNSYDASCHAIALFALFASLDHHCGLLDMRMCANNQCDKTPQKLQKNEIGLSILCQCCDKFIDFIGVICGVVL
jgi:hypothetical protein